ncbi:6-pyruvoyl tetrahydrobiopterin synthase-like [Schistocerca gregaria]|uniref:6-pyruvoyl tetrahydrobiopterin synthase-like n=1 Tax=Schistocerca gregaria TaxID=7010 RepID=UPI00211F3EE5|nr:6-pyruvoyl tetrahydrobiopterin synthase-like [Schistocerca gregaria]
MPVLYVTRKESFCACHRLHSSKLSDSDNERVFGKCNSLNGHGHNYVVEVTVSGEPDPTTGMLINLADLKRYIDEAFLESLDHKNIDRDVEYFSKANLTSTTENLVLYMWTQLKKTLPDPKILYEVKCWETEKNSVFYRGEL